MELLKMIVSNDYRVTDKLNTYSHDRVYDTYTSRNIEGIFIFKKDKLVVCLPLCQDETIFKKMSTYKSFVGGDMKDLKIFVQDYEVKTFEEYLKLKRDLNN